MSNNTLLRNKYFDESSSSHAAREDLESEGPKNMWSDVDQVTMAHTRYVKRVNSSSSQELLNHLEKSNMLYLLEMGFDRFEVNLATLRNTSSIEEAIEQLGLL